MDKKREVLALLKEAGILLLIILVAGTVLSFVYSLTMEPILQMKEEEKQKTCQTVFATAESFEYQEGISELDLLTGTEYEGHLLVEAYLALDANGVQLGNVYSITTPNGYAGNINLWVGISMDGQVMAVQVFEINETPGLGLRAQEVLSPQFAGKTVDRFVLTHGDSVVDTQVDSISGATITSKAMVEAVNAALYIDKTLNEGGATVE